MEDGKVTTFTSTWESLQQYQCPDWFRDAKFGIWAHWGPQAVPMVGDWYARHMYMPEGIPEWAIPVYDFHVRNYGHPSKFGYKDIINLWKAEKFDPEKLIDLYRNCGAKYFVAAAAHSDNYDCWNSTHHRWNSVKTGPGKDIVGLWCKAARAVGLPFGVTDHFQRAWSWFNTNKGADKAGPYAGVPYDGCDPENADLYLEPHEDSNKCYPVDPPQSWMHHWLRRAADLVDQYDPDLYYTDGGVPFGKIGREMIAYFYNRNMERRGGKLDAVYTVKDPEHLKLFGGDHGDYRPGIGVLDIERGVVDGIQSSPWQTDTCIGNWYYNLLVPYKKPQEIIDMLVDIVSKNGNLLLNFPLRPEGVLDEQSEWTVKEIGRWLKVNGEGIYGTRPWAVCSEGRTQLSSGTCEEKQADFSSQDFRFTRKGETVYVFAMRWNRQGWHIQSLADMEVKSVEILGVHQKVEWNHTPNGLEVQVPNEKPCDYVYCVKIN